MISLGVKYRPTTFDDVVGQESIIKILKRQIELSEFKNVLLFSGASGCGKTTAARIFANEINDGVGAPIEIDAASNNGVDSIRSLVASANERSLSGKYKVFIIDECHVLTSQSWQAFLKCIEEPPAFTIFIFCTTDPQKIPNTIMNRVQRFNFTKIPNDKIKSRLRFVCDKEGFSNYDEGIEYITKISNGGMRDALANLDKAVGYSTDLSVENVILALGNYSYDAFFALINAIIDGDCGKVVSIVEYFANQGNDLKLFVNEFFEFCLDLSKYLIFNSFNLIKIPESKKEDLQRCVNLEKATEYYNYIIDKLLELKNMLKNDSAPKTTVEVVFLQMARCK